MWNFFKKTPSAGPEIINVKKKKPAKTPPPQEVYDFSFNEYRFGHNSEKGTFFKTYPVNASLYGFFKFETEEISSEEYSMWKDSLENPQLYVIEAEALGRGLKRYTILKKEQK